MSFSFYDLPIKLQKFFRDYHLAPTGIESANHDAKMILENFSAKKFKVRLTNPLKKVDGTLAKEIVVDGQNLYTAFLPQVWQGLSVEQKTQLINLTYNDIVTHDKTLKTNPPKLAFFGEYMQDFLGLYDNKSHKVTVNLSKIIDAKDGFDIPSYLVHELTHAKQKICRDELIKNETPVSAMTPREVSLMFPATSNYLSAFNFFDGNDLDLLKQLVVGKAGITEQDLETYKIVNDSNNVVWKAILKLPYLCHPMEVEAFRTQNYFRNKMIDTLSSQYEIAEQKHLDTFKQVLDVLNSKQYKVDDKTVEMLVRLNYALCSTVGDEYIYENPADALDITCSGLKTLIDLYRNKQIENIDYLDYDKLLILKQQSLENKTY